MALKLRLQKRVFSTMSIVKKLFTFLQNFAYKLDLIMKKYYSYILNNFSRRCTGISRYKSLNSPNLNATYAFVFHSVIANE